jgi:hypothetical protein
VLFRSEDYVLPTVIMTCGHVYCAICIMHSCDNSDINKCPICNIKFNKSNLKRIYL